MSSGDGQAAKVSVSHCLEGGLNVKPKEEDQYPHLTCLRVILQNFQSRPASDHSHRTSRQGND